MRPVIVPLSGRWTIDKIRPQLAELRTWADSPGDRRLEAWVGSRFWTWLSCRNPPGGLYQASIVCTTVSVAVLVLGVD
jgi:hypothetical protein